ncbi:amidohydrolase [Deinococcus ruber]|uniref:N-acyl-L-amino acid amidohydrolase n=1 Tax=Deinococcus ruber TaxID=1848197 RepID=A0A918CIW0_9DEIO|nr:amidohydrolase [Deinococcus ruber]GGR24629.1 N-acyl-L-amino acid amidohydrolase [Deinococcus ruber]
MTISDEPVTLNNRAARLLPQLQTWRRHLHQFPEVSFQEHQTAAYIASELRQMPNLEVSQPTATSVLAVRKGTQPGRTVLLRADIDALPILEENSFEYVSQNAGAMHACGHDGHTAILLGTAKLLSEQAETAGELRMIFQHAEEQSPGGAEELVFQTDLMDGVDVVTGLHLNSQLPSGVVAVKPGAFMAAPDNIYITILGRGGHAAHPEEAIDPIAIGAQVVGNLQHVVSRGTSALEALVVSVTYFQAGSTTNVIPERAELKGTVRTFSPELRERAPELIERVVRGICDAHGAKYEFRYELGYRPLINDDGVAEVLRQVALETVGEDRAVVAQPTMGGEDFSAYLQKAPGAYFNVGSGTRELESDYPHHHPRFTIDEEALVTGVQMMAAAAQRLAQPD